MWEGSWHGWTWLKFAQKRHLRKWGGEECVYTGGDSIFYILSPHKKLSADLSSPQPDPRMFKK